MGEQLSTNDAFTPIFGNVRGTGRPREPWYWWEWYPGYHEDLREWLRQAHADGFDRLSVVDGSIPFTWTAVVTGGGRTRTFDLGQQSSGWLDDWWPQKCRDERYGPAGRLR